MTRIGMLFVLVLAGCAGSPSAAKAPAPERTEAVSIPETETAGYEAPAPEPIEESAPIEAIEPIEPEVEPAAPAPEPASDVTMTAVARLESVKNGEAMGTLTFELGADGAIKINGEFSGLKKNGVHALYIHEKGDCRKKGTKVGGHLNPTKAKHGPPASSERHAGDFGNLAADAAGNAIFEMTTDSITMEGDRPDSILDRAVVIHSRKDDKKGKAGAALACGVIELAAE